MASSSILQQYKEQSILTATPGELVVMLYNAAIKNINLAILNIKNKDIPAAHSSIVKAEDIFTELIISLDMKYPISAQLHSFYQFISEKLVEANIKKDAAILEEILPLVTDMRNMWVTAEKQSRIEQSAKNGGM